MLDVRRVHVHGREEPSRGRHEYASGSARLLPAVTNGAHGVRCATARLCRGGGMMVGAVMIAMK